MGGRTLDLSGLVAGDIGAVPAEAEDNRVLREVTAEVDGRRYRLKLWVPEAAGTAVAGSGRPTPSASPRSRPASTPLGFGRPSMQGTIVKVLVAEGDTVEVGQTVCILEAMKMENAVNAEKAGVVREIRVAAGDSVGGGDVVAVIE